MYPTDLEAPVEKAVKATWNENPTCSGLLHKVNGAYAICYEHPSERLIRIARICGLWVSQRTHIKSRIVVTDVWLYGITNPHKAKRYFDHFANMYSEARN